MTDAISRQVGGDHYKTGGIQPFELAYANRYDDLIFTAIKYVARHRRKAKWLDLEKADHSVEFRVPMIHKHGAVYGVEVFPISAFLMSNSIAGLEAEIITDLHNWSVKLPKGGETPESIASSIRSKIAVLNQTVYGEQND